MGLHTPSAASLIAVPFLGYAGGDIKVSDMVNTPQLGVGSKLYVPNEDGTYNVWTKGSDGKWAESAQNVIIGADGVATAGETPAAKDVTTKRGGAFWLEPNGSSEKIFYLLGQPTDATGSSALVSGKWNLIGNTSEAPKDITAGVEGEKVCVPNGTGILITYTFSTTKKGWMNGRTVYEKVTIQPGKGFWYLSKGTETINW